MHIRSVYGFAVAILLAASLPIRAADKPTDPQIAHIAYTAGDLDIKAAKQALKKSKDKNVHPAPCPGNGPAHRRGCRHGQSRT